MPPLGYMDGTAAFAIAEGDKDPPCPVCLEDAKTEALDGRLARPDAAISASNSSGVAGQSSRLIMFNPSLKLSGFNKENLRFAENFKLVVFTGGPVMEPERRDLLSAYGSCQHTGFVAVQAGWLSKIEIAKAPWDTFGGWEKQHLTASRCDVLLQMPDPITGKFFEVFMRYLNLKWIVRTAIMGLK
jgi:hypothetical protein